MSAPDPYSRTTIHGKPIDQATAVAIREVEHQLGYELGVFQGIGGAEASAGTHLTGRVVDLDPEDPEKELPALKRIGFSVFRRRYRPGVWAEHYHAALIFVGPGNARGIAPSALAQIREYLAGGDGLVGEYDDPDPWRPSPPAVFTVEDYRRAWARQNTAPKTEVQKARTRIRASIADLKQAIAFLDNTDPSRVVARAQMDELQAAKRELREALDRMPQR
jgi:hypothetical protein